MENVYAYEREANYYETDKMGIIHHSNYIRWFEEARIGFMKNIGFPYDAMEDNGIMMPVLSVECDYKSSVRFGDTVLIYVTITRYTGIRLELSYKVCDKKTGELRTTGSSSHCFTTTSLKPLRLNKINPEISEMFDKYKNASV
ncbi:MAG: acyl-CoA thioesterase [Oscillospiraceae bacterium]